MDDGPLLNSITAITQWGLKSSLYYKGNVTDLKKQLVQLYLICLELSYKSNDIEYTDAPDFDHEVIAQNISTNFPDFGYYPSLPDIQINNESEIFTADAVDELLDIILDLLQTQWRYDNNGRDDALWFLNFSFTSHFEKHIVSLLSYIKAIG